MKRSIEILAASEALSPITHMMGSEGNRGVVMREPVMTGDGIRWVPCLSGNALRHRAIRRPIMQDLIDRWELSGQLTVAQLNFLLHGGSLTEKGGRVSITDQHELYRCFPILRLIGCSLPGQIVPGSLQCWRGILVCRENQERLQRLIPDGWERPKFLRPAVAQIYDWLYTRSDAAKSAPDVVAIDQAEPGDSNLMIFEGQAVAAGAVFVHGFTLTSGTDVERGALYHALGLWREVHGNSIGGQASRGHGRLSTAYLVPDDEDTEALRQQYLEYLPTVREAAVYFLQRVFHLLPEPEADEDADPDAGETEEPAAEPAPKRRGRKKAEVTSDD